MDLSAAFKAAYRTYLARPDGILPFYLLGSAVPAAARTVPVLAIIVVGAAVSRAGELDAIREELAAVGPFAYEELSDPEAIAAIDETVVAALGDVLFQPAVIGPIVLSGVAAVVVFVVANAAVTAAQIHGVVASAGGATDLGLGLAGIRRHTATFVGLLFIEIFAYVVVVGAIVVVIAAVAGIAGPVALLPGIVGVFTMVIVAPTIRLIFAFAPVVAVVDDVGLKGALSGATGFAVNRPWTVLGYAGVFIGGLTAVGILSAVFVQIGAEVVTGLVFLLVVSPILDTLKAVLYGGLRVYEPIDEQPAVQDTITGGVWGGVDELVAFVRQSRGLLVISAAIFVVTGYVGWLAGGFFDGILTTSIERRLEDTVLFGDFLFYLGNNWQVAYSSAFAGLGLAIPTVVSLATNGLLFGGIARLEVAPEILAAFVIPHGLVEIPGLVIAGALGLYLGIVVWRRLRGDIAGTALAEAVGQAYRVSIGLVVVFAVAAAVEAFISPFYWRFLGL